MAVEVKAGDARKWIVGGLSSVEDVVYVGLGILLAIAALALLATALQNISSAIWHHVLFRQLDSVLDEILLVLLIIELLYTVQVSFREHTLLPEPFLVVALIAVVRRVLVVIAQVPKVPEAGDAVFRHYMYELSVLGLMVLALVVSLVMLQRYSRKAF